MKQDGHSSQEIPKNEPRHNEQPSTSENRNEDKNL